MDEDIIAEYLTEDIKREYIIRKKEEKRSVIIRQYCRIIAKFIDRKDAEELIDKIITIVRNDSAENADNDRTYYNYYGGKSAALYAWVKHLCVTDPKYDAKLHLYLLEHVATPEYIEEIENATEKWENIEKYENDIEHTINEIKERNDK